MQGPFNAAVEAQPDRRPPEVDAGTAAVRGADYVIKRSAFAVVTVFVAVTLNFALFRLAPGNAVTNLSRVPHATPETRHRPGEAVRPRQVEARAVRPLPEAARARGTSASRSRTSSPCRSNLESAIENTIPMVLLGTVFAIVIGTLTGVLAAWRRGTAVESGQRHDGARLLLDADALARADADHHLRRACCRPAG